MIDQRLDQALREWADDLIVPVEAAKIVAELREHHPKELAEWLDVRAEQIVTEALGRRLRGYRRQVRHQAGPRAFERWRKQVVDGDRLDPPTALTMPFCVSADGVWKKLADMTGRDLLYVAEQREESAVELQLEARFLRQLAKRLEGEQTVGERFTPEEVKEVAAAA